MERFRNLFSKKKPPPPPAEVQEPVLQRRRRQKRPAPAPPVPNTPQRQPQLAPTSSYNPPSNGNLFSSYKYPENFLNPWDDIKEPTTPNPTSDASRAYPDPVAESKRAWAQYDRQVTLQ